MSETQEPVPDSEQDAWPVEPVDEPITAHEDDAGDLNAAAPHRRSGDENDPAPSGREGLAGR